MAEGGTFDAIRYGGRGTSAEGTLNVSDTGIVWKKTGVRHCTTALRTYFGERARALKLSAGSGICLAGVT